MTDHVTSLRIEPLSQQHVRTNFDCGRASLNDYLKKFARQNDDNNLAKTFVAADNKLVVHGYYCLSAASIDFENLPDVVAKGLPRYPIPAVLIGRLACDQSIKGQGLGARLLVNALQRIADVSEEMGIKVVLVDAIDEDAKDFYQHYGFISLSGHTNKLFLPIDTVLRMFSA